jgi:hypothetical protein
VLAQAPSGAGSQPSAATAAKEPSAPGSGRLQIKDAGANAPPAEGTHGRLQIKDAGAASAQPPPSAPTTGAQPAQPPAPTPPADTPPPPSDTPEPSTLGPGGQLPPAASAAEALDRASAAYEFGELEMMITLARMVAEGAVPGDEDQRAEALRLLGIGLYVQGRQDGAERAFMDLIRLRPATNLDPATTRPEVVAFFRDVRRRNQPKKYMALAFLPPLGQFQNNAPARGWLFGALETATFGAALTTRLILADWVDANKACKGGSDPAPCNRMKLYNAISVAALVATWTTGVIDALVGLRSAPPLPPRTEPRAATSALSLAIHPTGAALRVSF